MKIKLFTLVLIFLTTLMHAQSKEIYLNDDLLKISKAEFNNTHDQDKFFDLRFELDALVVIVKVQKIRKGKISNELFNTIKSELKTLSGDTISNDNIIVINYFHGVDKCNSSANKSYVRASYKRFLKKIRTMKNVNQFFMYKSLEGTEEYGEQLNWIEDKFRTIESTFLPLEYPCGSYVLMDKNGNFYVNKGEYDIEKIIDLLDNNKTTFTK